MLMIGVAALELAEHEKRWLSEPGVAGVLLFSRNYQSRDQLSALCDGVLEKTRHHVRVDGVLFEVDEFDGDNRGLVVAEVELPAVDAPFPRPPWLGREVSALVRYYNVNLIAHPYRQWSPAERAAEDAAC